MKKLFFLIGVLVLTGAGCSTVPQPSAINPSTTTESDLPNSSPIELVIQAPGNYAYRDYTQNWKLYVSPNKEFSFKYPAQGSVDGANWEMLNRVEVNLEKNQDPNTQIRIERIENNNVSVQNLIDQIKANSAKTLVTDQGSNGNSAVRVDAISKGDTGYGTIDIFFSRESYYIHLNTHKFGIPYYDFLTEAVISTLEVR